MLMKSLASGLCLALILLSCTQEPDKADPHGAHEQKIASPCLDDSDAQIAVADAWVRSTADIGSTGAAYFTLCNNGPAPITLNAITASIASTAEIHETTRRDDGVVSMKPISALVVAPGTSVALKPGGTHVMLVSVTESVTDGDQVQLTLAFSDGTSVETLATARSLLPGAEHNH